MTSFAKQGRVFQAPKWAATNTRDDIQVKDAFSNLGARLGFGTNDLINSTSYPTTRMSFRYQELVSLYRSSWVARQVCEAIAMDMVRHWCNIKGEIEPRLISKFERSINRTRTPEKILQALIWSRLFGGAGAVIIIDGHEDILDQPLDLDDVAPGSYCGLQVFDRWSGITPSNTVITDMREPDYGLPSHFEISPQQGGSNTGSGNLRVHHSRVLRFLGRALPKWEQIAETYWGLSEIEIIWDALRMADNTQWNIASLMFQANIMVMKTSDNLAMNLGMATQQQQQRFQNTLNAMRASMTNQGMLLLDKEGGLESHQMSFTGIADVWEKMMLTVCGAAQIPMSRLYGMTQGGLSQTNEGDERQYFDLIGQKQNRELRPNLEKLFQVVQMSEFGEIQPDFDFGFVPLHLPSDKERSELAKSNTDAVTVAWNAGYVPAKVCLQELKQQSAGSGLWSNITDEMIEAAEDTVPQPMGDMPGGDATLDEPDDDKNAVSPTRLGLVKKRAVNDHAIQKAPHAKRITFAGLDIVIEWEAGEQRKLTGADGAIVYSRPLRNAYGYLVGTVGRDGDEVDVILGDDEAAGSAYVIAMKDLGPVVEEREDEDKALVGFPNSDAAELAFARMYSTEWIEDITEMSLAEFREWLRKESAEDGSGFIFIDSEDAGWNESEHPRGKGEKGGQFVSKGSGGSASSAKSVGLVKKASSSPPPPADESKFSAGSKNRAIEDRFRAELHKNWDGAKTEYTNRFGKKIINVDEARELSPEYEKDRSLAPAVQDPASELVKSIYEDRLNDPSVGKSVCFTAGGPGSGKSSGIESVPKLKKMTDRAGIVYDGVFDKLSSSSDKIDKALAAGKTAKVMFVYRDPAEAFRNGILKRASRMEGEKGSGRTVPASYASMVYARVQQAQKDIRARYKDNPKVKFYAVDNSRGAGQAKSVKLEDLPGQNVTAAELQTKFNQIADEEYKAGKISKRIWEGVKQ